MLGPAAVVPQPGTGMEALLAGMDGVVLAVSVAAVAVACIEIN